MTSTRPYLIRAFYEWIADNDLTPYIVVNANYPGVEVPLEYVDNGQIVLNIAMHIVKYLELNNSYVSFEARFRGIPHTIHVPCMAIMAIYAKENGRGMVFSEDDAEDEEDPKNTKDKNDSKIKSKSKSKDLEKDNQLKVLSSLKEDPTGEDDDGNKKGKNKSRAHLTVIK